MKAHARRPRVAVVIKRTSYSVLVEENHDPHVTRLLADGDPVVARMRGTHAEHTRTVAQVHAALERIGAEETLVTRPGEPVGDVDLVVTVGGDGTFLAASHAVVGVPVLGINSAPSSSVGFFCGAKLRKNGEIELALQRALAGELKRTVLTRMQVSVNGRVVAARVLNEALFCHASPAATSRYIVTLDGVTEEQKSSGFWIGPAAGSTAAQRSAGGRVLPLGSQKLQLVVREPYTPHGERYRLRRALVGPSDELVVRNKTSEGRLFFDGPSNAATVALGDVVTFRRAPDPLVLLGLSVPRKWGER